MMNNSGRDLGLLLLRAGLGIAMLLHGLVRFPKLVGFSNKVVTDFANTLLPEFFVRGFAFVLPFLEFLVGLVILLGGRFLTRGLFSGGLVICLLMTGTALREDWATLGTQLIYLIAFAFALLLTDPRRS